MHAATCTHRDTVGQMAGSHPILLFQALIHIEFETRVGKDPKKRWPYSLVEARDALAAHCAGQDTPYRVPMPDVTAALLHCTWQEETLWLTQCH